jgi:hypothetical protein
VKDADAGRSKSCKYENHPPAENLMNEFAGRWRITAMEMWDQDYVDLVEPGFFEFGSDGMGSFVFGAVHG